MKIIYHYIGLVIFWAICLTIILYGLSKIPFKKAFIFVFHRTYVWQYYEYWCWKRLVKTKKYNREGMRDVRYLLLKNKWEYHIFYTGIWKCIYKIERELLNSPC